MKKFIVLFFVCALIVLSMTFYQKPVTYVNPMYLYDTSSREKAVGVSDYVFVAKVNDITDTKYVDGTPYTIYSISIVYDIKGGISGKRDLVQYGGLSKDGKSYVFLENGAFLNTNAYYILMPSLSDDGDLEVSDPNRIIKLPDTRLDSADNQSIIADYEKAYRNEVLPQN